MGIRIKRAFDKYGGDWSVRAVRSSENFIEYPADIETYRTPRSVVQALYDEADVIHCSNSVEPIRRYGRGRKKPAVVTYQGSAFRAQPQEFLRESAKFRAVQTCSTLDLVTLAPEVVQWQPHPIDVAALQKIRSETPQRPERVVIHHSPTNRRVKSTAAFMEAAGRLQDEDSRVEVRLIEGARWQDNMAKKAQADILYDQMILGWGTNALEAWGMGIPVIAATEFPRVRAEMVATLGELPCYEATPETLYDALKALVNDADLRAHWGQKGLAYVKRWHDEEVAVERLIGFYEEARSVFEVAA